MCANRHWVILNSLAESPLGFRSLNSASACSLIPVLHTNAFSGPLSHPAQQGKDRIFTKGDPECAHTLGGVASPEAQTTVLIWWGHSKDIPFMLTPLPQPTPPPTSFSELGRNPRPCTCWASSVLLSHTPSFSLG